eukprot:12913175-Prorocentrum_lima.AAC.1
MSLKEVVNIDVVALAGGGRWDMRQVLHKSTMSGINFSTDDLIPAACKILCICFCEPWNQRTCILPNSMRAIAACCDRRRRREWP